MSRFHYLNCDLWRMRMDPCIFKVLDASWGLHSVVLPHPIMLSYTVFIVNFSCMAVRLWIVSLSMSWTGGCPPYISFVGPFIMLMVYGLGYFWLFQSGSCAVLAYHLPRWVTPCSFCPSAVANVPGHNYTRRCNLKDLRNIYYTPRCNQRTRVKYTPKMQLKGPA